MKWILGVKETYPPKEGKATWWIKLILKIIGFCMAPWGKIISAGISTLKKNVLGYGSVVVSKLKGPGPFKFAIITGLALAFYDFITKNIVLCKIGWDYVTLLETCFAQYLVDKGYNYNVIIKENTLKFDKKACPSHNAFILEQWIFKKNAFAIKWKYVISYLKNTHVSSEFNFLSRFMYYGPYGYISNGEKKGLFIKSEDYYKIAY